MIDSDDAPYAYGVPLDGALARRELLANKYDIDFGSERVFPRLVSALLDEVPEGSAVLEVGAATGLLTRPLLQRAGRVTALEPSSGMLRRLLESDVAESPTLLIKQGMVEDLLHDERYDIAVVTFTPRRGMGLSRLLAELAVRVTDKVVMLLDDDGTMDWAYLARGAAIQGF
ncbi:MAG: class I SAM-dependent methyltransferase, partial [Coriobacteriia bacterium]|nr:class I SAM-dependent methyltransferase [Coriobacteriia bacterium]